MAPSTEARRHSIADDWEDVGEDNLSVVSLPDSDDEKVAVAPGKSALEESTRSTDTASYLSTVLRTDDASPHNNGKGKEAADKMKSNEGQAHRDRNPDDADPLDDASAEALYEPSVTDCLNFDPDDDHKDGDHGSLKPEDVDPGALLRDIESVRAILRDTIHSVDDLTTLHQETSENARKICRALALQVEELQPIVAGYARVWEQTTSDIPLDPGLQGWLSGVRVKALALQVELQDEVQRTLRAGRRVSTSGVLHLIWEYLESCEQQMDDFLPIMQVDFNEFQTHHMRIPTAPVPLEPRVNEPRASPRPVSNTRPTGRISGRNTYLPSTPTDQVPLLRTELYRLRDRTVSVTDMLDRLSRYFPASTAQSASDIAGQLRHILSTLSTMLTNHGSDWIDQGLSGGLTYAEFAELEVDFIRDCGTQVDRCLRSLEAVRRDIDPVSYTRYPSGRDFRCNPPADAVSVIAQLEVLAQVLSATLRVETR